MMKRILLLVLLMTASITASAQVHKVRQWSPLMGTRGWPIYIEAGQVTILDTSGIARNVAVSRLNREESDYIAGLQLPDKATFEQKLLEGEATEAALDRADEADKQRKEAVKAARAARDVRSTGTITGTDGYQYDVEMVESHATERNAANRTANRMRLLSKDEIAYSKVLDEYRRSVKAKRKK